MNTADSSAWVNIKRVDLQRALDGLISMADVMHRSEISTVPSARFNTWKASILALSDRLGVPQYAVFRDALHAAAELVSASKVAPQESVEGFLCRAWGETDLPEARLVRSQAEWEAFVVEAQWGPDVTYESLDPEDREQVDAQVRYIKADMADNSAGEIRFEIGGISVEHVTFLSIKEQAVKPATDKEMPK